MTARLAREREKADKAVRLHRLAEARDRQAELIALCQKLEQDLARRTASNAASGLGVTK